MIILFFFADSQLHIGGKELDHHFPTAHRLDLQLPGQRQYGQQERLRKRLSRAKQEEDVVEVATICRGKTPKQLANLRRLVSSMLDQSAGSKIRLTVLSDPDSWPSAHAVLRKTIGHYYAKGENLPAILLIENVDQYSMHTHLERGKCEKNRRI